MQIFMVSGRAGVGKTTFSNFCKRELRSRDIMATTVPFAGGVKQVAWDMGWDGKKDDRGRRLLQQIGNCGREYYENTWADKAIDFINDYISCNLYDVVFIDDWRFPNEGNVLTKQFPSVMKIRVVRPAEFHSLRGTIFYDDISETSLPEADEVENGQLYDLIVYNMSTLDELENTAKQFVERLVIPKLSGGSR